MAAFTPAPSVSPVLRQGNKIIVPAPNPGTMAILPPPCIKCGAPADGKPVVKTIYWHNPAFYLLILAGVLVYAIVALVVRKSVRISVPLCARHAQRRSTAVMMAWILPLIGIADIFILNRFDVDGGIIALVATAFILAGIIIWAVVGTPIRPRFIDQSRSEFTGFCQAYLQTIPEAAFPAVAPIGLTGQPAVPPPPIAPSR